MDELVEGRRQALSETRLERLEIIESENGGPTKVRCVAQEADSPNQNNRLYKRAILEREVGRLSERLSRHPGLANHPEGQPRVEDISVLWTGFTWDGNLLVAEGNLIPTRVGEDIAKIGKAGVEIGVSSRGFGSVARETINGKPVMVIGEDFELESFDFVLSPSVRSAYVFAMEGIETNEYSDLSTEVLYQKRPDLVQEIENRVRASLEISMDPVEEKVTQENETVEATEDATPVVEDAIEEETQDAEVASEEVVEDSPAESEIIEEVTEKVVAESAELTEAKAHLAEMTAERDALMEDAANMAAMMAMMTKEMGERMKNGDKKGAAMMASMRDTLKGMMGKGDMGKNMDALITSVDSVLEALEVHILHDFIGEKCRTERNSFALADALVAACHSKEEVDSKFEAIKASVAGVVAEAHTKGSITDESVDPAKAKQLEARNRYRGLI